MSTKREVAIRLALLFGWIGVHKFYQGYMAAGLLYMLFCWTLIPYVLAIADMLIMLHMSEAEYSIRYG